jgi:circadian clock protein KaiB
MGNERSEAHPGVCSGMKKKVTSATAQSKLDKLRYVLRLYIAGATPRSTRAIENLRKLCEAHLKSRYDLEVIDIYQQGQLARDEQIIAAPTLIRKLPLPLRRLVGDLSSTERVLIGLDLRSARDRAAPPRRPAQTKTPPRARKTRPPKTKPST